MTGFPNAAAMIERATEFWVRREAIVRFTPQLSLFGAGGTDSQYWKPKYIARTSTGCQSRISAALSSGNPSNVNAHWVISSC